jgi:hypothetical protein
MRNPNNTTIPNPRPLWAKILIALGTIVFIITTPIAIAEGFYQVRVNALNSKMSKINLQVIRSLGGVEYYSYVFAPHVWQSICLDNGPCPMVTKAWFVLVDSNGGSVLKQKVLDGIQKEGEATGTYDGRFPMYVDVTAAKNAFNASPPYSAPAGKEWVSVGVSVFEGSSSTR